MASLLLLRPSISSLLCRGAATSCSSVITTPLYNTLFTAPPSSSKTAASIISNSQITTHNGINEHYLLTPRRFRWSEVVNGRVQPDGSIKYEDPERTEARMDRALKREGLFKRATKYQYYEKPWMKRQRLKSEVVYKKNKRHVEDVKRWIVFRRRNGLPVEKYKDEDEEEF